MTINTARQERDQHRAKLISLGYDNGDTTTVASIADGHRILRRQGYWRGADYRNDDGVRVIEYWGSRREAQMEQGCPAPAYIVIEA